MSESLTIQEVLRMVTLMSVALWMRQPGSASGITPTHKIMAEVRSAKQEKSMA